MLAPWQAKREGEAKIIRAQTDAEILRLQAVAQSEARKLAIDPEVSVSGTVNISNYIEQSLKYQTTKRISNVKSVVEKTADFVEGEEVPSDEPNHDWTARFFEAVQDISSQQLQTLWSKILAGEIKSPGATSLLSLNILKNIDSETATLFESLCSKCVYLFPHSKYVFDARVPSMGTHAGQNALEKFGLNYFSLMTLAEHSLINSDLDSYVDIQICIGKLLDKNQSLRLPFKFNGQYWILQPNKHYTSSKDYKMKGVALTKAGRELSRVVNCVRSDDFCEHLMKYFASKNLLMVQVDKYEP